MYVCIVRRGAVGAHIWGVSCVHPMAVLNAAFCMTCSLLMPVEDAIGDSRAGLITAL